MKTFNILCPGLSLEKFEPCMLEAGDVIVVNSAISVYPEAKFWAMQDWEVYNAAYEIPILFVPSSWTTHRPDIQRNKITYEKGALGKAVGVNLELDRYTMTAAIGLAIFCGAGRIVLFGADLAGEGYFGSENKKTDHSEKRWVDERVLLSSLMKLPYVEIIRK